MNYQHWLARLPDADLKAAFQEAVDDCQKAGTEQPNSEWHEACFAACVVFSQEVSRRGLNAPPLR